MKRAVIVLPTINEAENIEEVVTGIFDVQKKTDTWDLHVLIVDSESTDNTVDLVKKMKKKYSNLHLLETKKEGLGKAYIKGFNYSLDNIKPYLIFEMDADLQHDPTEIPRFLKAIEEGADFVIGARYIKGGSIPKDWALHRKMLSMFANFIVRFGFMKPRISDWTSGYRAIKAWIVKDAIPHITNYSGYVFQVAFLDFALKKNAVVSQVPINFRDRSHGASKLDSIETILQTLYYVVTNSSFVKFVIVGGMGFIIDFSIAYYLIHSLMWPIPASNALSAEVAIISNFLLNNFWSFAHKQIEGGVPTYLKKLLAFNIVSSGSILIQWLGMTIAIAFLGNNMIHVPVIDVVFSSWIIYKVFIILLFIIPYSYIIYNRVIWKSRRSA
jgi:dolichol-phosphate mannosyltransferase